MQKEEVAEIKELLFGDRGYKPRYQEWELVKMRKMAYKCGAMELAGQYGDSPSFVWDDESFEKFDHLTRIVEYKINRRRQLLTRRL